MTVTGDLEQIRAKVRRLTARPSANQITDAELNDYINDFYIYDLPQVLKQWDLKSSLSPIEATTTGGDRILTEGRWLYTVDSNQYISLEPPFYVGGYEIEYFQDVRSFFNYFPTRTSSQTLATATGIAGPYSGTVTGTPILFNSVFITAQDGTGNTLVVESDEAGNLIGDVVAGGTIDLITGAVANLTFTALIPVGNIINSQAVSYVEARPQAVLYQDDTLTFYPVPDTAYEISCVVYSNPAELTGVAEPEIRQWWNLIAMGAAIKIFTDNLDVESIAKIQPLYDQQKRLVLRKTLKQLSTQRVGTIFDGYNYGDYGQGGYRGW